MAFAAAIIFLITAIFRGGRFCGLVINFVPVGPPATQDALWGSPGEGRMDERWVSRSGKGRGYNRNFFRSGICHRVFPTSVSVTPGRILIM